MEFPKHALNKGGRVTATVFSGLILLLASSYTQANPFLEGVGGGGASSEEIRELRMEVQKLKEDFNALYMIGSSGPKAGFGEAPYPSGEQDLSEESLSDRKYEGYFEVNGMYILKNEDSAKIKYLNVNENNFKAIYEKEKYGPSSNKKEKKEQ